MKKLLSLIVLFMLSLSMFSQETKTPPPNMPYDNDIIGYVGFSPMDLGFAARFDVNHLYTTFSWGNYTVYPKRIPYKAHPITHNRVSVGTAYQYYTIGLVYHEYGEYDKETHSIGYGLDSKFSIELGARMILTKHIAVAMRYDPLRHEVYIDIGALLNKY